MGKAIRENPMKTRVGEGSQLGECLFAHREKGLF